MRQKDIANDGPYPVYGASGIVGYSTTYQNEVQYVAVIKDGAGVGRARLCEPMSSVLGTMQALIPNEGVDCDYLLYLVDSMKLGSGFTGTTIPHIYFKDYGKRLVTAYDSTERHYIASTLNALESLMAICRDCSSKLDQLVKSRFAEMFGDYESNEYDWPKETLKERIQFLTSGSRGWAKYYSEEGELFITIKNVKDCKISLNDVQHVMPPHEAEAARTRVQAGDLLVSVTADLGRTGVVSEELANQSAYINQHLMLVRLDREYYNPLFVAYFMESPFGRVQFAKKNMAGVKAGLNFDSMKSFRLFRPPINVQDEFVSFAQQVDKSKFAVQQAIEQLETLKASLMQKYFG